MRRAKIARINPAVGPPPAARRRFESELGRTHSMGNRAGGKEPLGLRERKKARLRQEITSRLGEAPRGLRFKGLRGCVKQLMGARRWTGRCQELNDQIVEYLRDCLTQHEGGANCAMWVD